MTSDLHHLASAYALDALDDDERRAFEAHFPSCDICSQDVVDFRGVAAALAETVATPPPTDLKDRVMAEIGQTRQHSPLGTQVQPTAPRSLSRWWLAAAAALILLGGVFIATLDRDQRDDFDQLVAAPDATVTTLAATSEDQLGNLQVIWSDELDRAVVVGSDMAEPGRDLVYALWFLLDDGVALAGLFEPEAGNVTQLLDVADMDTLGWGISIEPATGSEQPTTDVLFLGTI